MKRAEALRPLSGEHLAALQVAKALREAEDAPAPTRAPLEFWREDGKAHFRAAEEILLPAAARAAEVDRDGVSLEEAIEHP